MGFFDWLNPFDNRPYSDNPIDAPQHLISHDRGVVHYAMPKLFVAEKCLNDIADGINTFSRQSSLKAGLFGGGSTETGYALIGVNESDSILINGLLEAGPKAEYSYGHVKFDRDYQQEKLDKVQLVFPDVGHAGDVHLHPGSMNSCSGGDLTTDSGNVRASASKEMVFIIVTRAGFLGLPDRVDKHVLKIKGLQFNFYYLGESTNYRYRPIVPQVVTAPTVAVLPRLEQYFQEHPIRAKLDFEALKKLPDHDFSILKSDQYLVLKIVNKSLGYRLVIKHNNGSCTPTCQVVRNGKVESVSIESLANWNPSIWFTQICIEVEKLMSVKYPKVKEPKNERVVQAYQRQKSTRDFQYHQAISGRGKSRR